MNQKKSISTFWKIVVSLNITEIILFMASRIISIIIHYHGPFVTHTRTIINSFTGTYYYRIGSDLMITNLIFLVISIIGIYCVLKNIKVGKFLLVITSLLFLLNRAWDLIMLTHLVYFVILVVIIYVILNKIVKQRTN